MDRCKAAFEYHHQGCNCAQSVLVAFADQTELTREQLMAMAGGFGGGVGGSRAELCGAISGGVMTLGVLFPHRSGEDSEAKRKIATLASDFRRAFIERFDATCCGALLAARPAPGAHTPAAVRLGITAHCDVMIVTAVEIVESLITEPPPSVIAKKLKFRVLRAAALLPEATQRQDITPTHLTCDVRDGQNHSLHIHTPETAVASSIKTTH